MYMSYCKFEGTLSELRSCLKTVEEHVNGEAECEVSDNEIRCFKNMVMEFMDWMHDMALLDDEGYVDEDELAQVCDDMARSCDEPEKDDGLEGEL